MPSPRKLKAFTLVELMAAMLLISVLIVLIFPLAGKMRSLSQTTRCLGNMRNYGTAVLLYASENNGFPYWNGKGANVGATDPPSQRIFFQQLTLPYTQVRLRCPKVRPDSGGYSFSYTGNAALCMTYNTLRDIPAPASRVVLALEFSDYEKFYWSDPLNKAMYGSTDANPKAEGQDETLAQFHGSAASRGMHLFFLDGHVSLVPPENGDWRQGKGSTYGDASNGGYFYDYKQFNAMQKGTLKVQ